MKDNVNSPTHYTQYCLEVIDFMKLMSDIKQCDKFTWQCMSNVYKYVLRYQHKNGVEDLEKAIKYLEFISSCNFRTIGSINRVLNEFINEVNNLASFIIISTIDNDVINVNELKYAIIHEIKELNGTNN